MGKKMNNFVLREEAQRRRAEERKEYRDQVNKYQSLKEVAPGLYQVKYSPYWDKYHRALVMIG